MATNRGLVGWRRRERARERAVQLAEIPARLSDIAQAQLAYWRGHVEHPSFVYFVVEEPGGSEYVKIGYAADPDKRTCELQVGNPRRLIVASLLYGTLASEQWVHQLWRHQQGNGEWFALAPQITAWAVWAEAVQRQQHEAGAVPARVRGMVGKDPNEWRRALEEAV
jgi:hypothetical protein